MNPMLHSDGLFPSVNKFDLFQMPFSAREFFYEKFSTGSKVLDLIFGGLVFILFMQLSNKSSNDLVSLVSSVIRWFFGRLLSNRNKGEIEFLIEQVNQVSSCFTPTYRAIMYKLGNVKNNQIWRFKERRLEWFDNLENKNVKECLYQVLQTEPIQVEDDVWVRCEERSEDRTTIGGNQIMYVVTYKVCVFSKTKTVHHLKKIVDKWLKEYKDYKKNQLSGKQLIFMVKFPDKDFDSNQQSPAEDIQFSTFKTFRSFRSLFFEQKNEVLNDINFFLNEKEWHKKRGLPDSLGILCYGIPGCGKTSFIKALLKETNRHGVVFSVNRQTKLESIERLMRSETLCDFPIPQNRRVYILEDIDAMGDLVTKRKSPTDEKISDQLDECKKENVTREKEEEIFERQLFKWLKFGISKSSDHHLGFFLNLLDGLVETPGRIIIMTTNHIEKLDPALIRPGRVDINIEFVKCSRNVAKQIVSHFYKKGIEEWELGNEVMDGQITPAELTQICRMNKFDFEGCLEGLRRWMIIKRAHLERHEITETSCSASAEKSSTCAVSPSSTPDLASLLL